MSTAGVPTGEELLDEAVPPGLVERVVAHFNPVRVILFGSHARGEAGPDSDYDLLIVLDDDAPAKRLRPEAGYRAVRPARVPVDLLTCRRSAFEAKRDVVGSLAHAIAREGIVVHERR